MDQRVYVRPTGQDGCDNEARFFEKESRSRDNANSRYSDLTIEILYRSIWPQFLKDSSIPFDSIRVDCIGKVVHRRLYGNS